jgi:hypothetical protein
MGLIVIPIGASAWGKEDTVKRTFEINFAPCSIMAYASVVSLVHYERIYYAVGLKRVRQRKPDGSDRTITLGTGSDRWPRAWCGDNITSVTFAIAVNPDVIIDALAIVHTS